MSALNVAFNEALRSAPQSGRNDVSQEKSDPADVVLAHAWSAITDAISHRRGKPAAVEHIRDGAMTNGEQVMLGGVLRQLVKDLQQNSPPHDSSRSQTAHYFVSAASAALRNANLSSDVNSQMDAFIVAEAHALYTDALRHIHPGAPHRVVPLEEVLNHRGLSVQDAAPLPPLRARAAVSAVAGLLLVGLVWFLTMGHIVPF